MWEKSRDFTVNMWIYICPENLTGWSRRIRRFFWNYLTAEVLQRAITRDIMEVR